MGARHPIGENMKCDRASPGTAGYAAGAAATAPAASAAVRCLEGPCAVLARTGVTLPAS